MTLTEFLLARIAEDESRWARAESPWTAPHDPDCDYPGDMPGTCTCDLLDRLKAECEARRRIVGEHPRQDWLPTGRDECARCGCADDNAVKWPCPTLKALAAVYAADHPDYREEWRP